MRRTVLGCVAAVALFGAPAAFAAPSCVDRNGDAIRCGVSGAMPVGWDITPEQQAERLRRMPPDPPADELFALICVIGGFFALIGLMPPFDGWRDGDWDKQEGDDQEELGKRG